MFEKIHLKTEERFFIQFSEIEGDESDSGYTVRKMDPILRSIQRMLQTQLFMARKSTLQPYRR